MIDKTYMTPFKGETVRPLLPHPLRPVREHALGGREPLAADDVPADDPPLRERPDLGADLRRLRAARASWWSRRTFPGMKKEDIRIFMEDGALVLQGERKEEEKVEKESYYLTECNYGSFYRRLPLTFAADTDKIAAKFTDGVLVHVPMPRPWSRPSRGRSRSTHRPPVRHAKPAPVGPHPG